ncbi:UBX domain-containing protein 4 isoform X1 [Plodia interpunctella]|uniref:UBX domain-containing protein 4 isoform X1 n=2 Tax=Plodia interpunctella TaxID=58824 RepID=UPI002367A793|nr:UBX domain-containing protein 4 isoform X1 [Plodia interpunctella]
MHWFGGSIAEAVNLSKQKNAIFVVFIEGDNELSSEMAATIDDTVVVKRLSDQGNFLAIKLKSGTTNYTHFAQIYQFVPVPSLFFIGRNGTPLEVVCAGVQPANLATRIDRILEEHHKEKPSVQPSTSSQSIKETSSPQTSAQTPAAPTPAAPTPAAPTPATATPAIPTPAPAIPVTPTPAKFTPEKPEETPDDTSEPAAKVQKTHHETKSGQQYTVVCDGDVCVRQPTAPDQPGPSQPTAKASAPESVQSEASIEEKLERAKELIEAKRREKAAQEKELEKQKEMERRNTGQGVAELKRWQAEQEMKQIQEERKREKLENNMARQRILEQIAQDRAERRARDFVPTVQQTAPVAPVTPATVAAAGGAATSGDNARARIQFKLPDGSSHTAQFPADSKLSDVTRYIADNLQMSESQISLWTAFPRQELQTASASLRALQLAPSAALLVRARRPAPAPPLAGLVAFVTQFFTSFILEPTQQFYTWLCSRLFPPAIGGAPGGAPGDAPRPPPEGPRGSPPPGLRKRGNIHRLPGERPGEDDNNTWNGNSTQQM